MKRLLVALGLILVLALAAPVVLSGFVDWNTYKESVAERIGAAIGHKVEIDGELRIALLPTPLLSVSGVRIANAAGFDEPDMVRLKRLDATIALLPLLGGHIQVERVLLDGPDVVYDVAPNGVSNWQSTRVEPPFGLDLSSAVSFDGVVVRDGDILFRDRRDGREERIEGIGGTVAASSLNGPFQASGSLTLRGVEVRAELTGGRYAPGVAMPLRATLTLPGGGGAVARFAGIVSGDATTGPRLRGDVRAEGTNLAAALMPVLAGFGNGAEPPPALDRSFSLRGLLEADAARTQFSSFEWQLGDSRATGTVVLNTGDRPDLQVSVNANRADLDPWLGVDLRGLTGALPAGMTGAVTFGADVATLAGGPVRQVRLDAKLADGAVSIDRLSAQLPGGADFSAAGTLGPENGQPMLDLQMETNADNLRAVLEWLHADLSGIPADRLRKASLSGRLRGMPGRFDLTGVDLRFDATRITGGVSYVDRRGRPALGVQLDIDRLNADAYGITAVQAGALGRWIAENADVSLKATAANLTVADMPAQGVAFDAAVVGGIADIRELKVADVAGVALGLEGRLLGPSPDSPAHVTLDLSGSSPTGLSHAITWPSWLPAPDDFGPFQLHARLIGRPERVAVEVKGEALGAAIEAAGTVEGAFASPSVDLKTRVTTDDAPALLRRLRGSSGPGTAALPGDLYAAVTGDAAKLTLSDLQGTLGAGALRGQATLALGGERPQIDADLQLTDADIDRALRVLLDVRQGTDPLDLSWLSRADATLALTATNAQLMGQRLDNPAAKLKLSAGVLKLEQLDATLQGGRLGLSGQIEAAANTAPVVTAEVTISKARPSGLPLPGGLGLDADGLDGEMALTTAGSSAQAMVRALSGKGWLSVRDGALTGADALASVERLRQGGDASARSGERTAFSNAAASLRIERGAVRTDDLHMTSALGTLRAMGEWRPAEDSIDARISLDRRAGGGDALVFRVTGPAGQPRKTLESATSPADTGAAAPQPAPSADSPAAQSSTTDVIRGLLEGLRR